MLSLFILDANGRRPAHGANPRFQRDPTWRDQILFYEYFHGDTGEGLGASHQTGWTALAGALMAHRRLRARRFEANLSWYSRHRSMSPQRLLVKTVRLAVLRPGAGVFADGLSQDIIIE